VGDFEAEFGREIREESECCSCGTGFRRGAVGHFEFVEVEVGRRKMEKPRWRFDERWRFYVRAQSCLIK